MATIDRHGDWHSRKTGKYINKPWALGLKLSGLFGAEEPTPKAKALIDYSKSMEDEMTSDRSEDEIVAMGEKLETLLDAAIPEINKAKVSGAEDLDQTLEDFETSAFFLTTPRIWPEVQEEKKPTEKKAGVYPVGSAKSKTRGQLQVPRYTDEDRERLGLADMKPEDRAEFIRLRKQYVSAATARDGVGGGVFLGEVADLKKAVADNAELQKELQGWIDGMKKRMGIHDEEWALKRARNLAIMTKGFGRARALSTGTFAAVNAGAFSSALSSLGDTAGASSVGKMAAAGDTAGLNKLLESKVASLEKASAALETFCSTFGDDFAKAEKSSGGAKGKTQGNSKGASKAGSSAGATNKDGSPRKASTQSAASRSAAGKKGAATRKSNGGGEQWRAPVGSAQGGEFIDMPQTAAAKVGSMATSQKMKSLINSGRIPEAQKLAEKQLALMDQALNSLYSMQFSVTVGAMTASGGATVAKAKWEGPLGFEGQFTGDNRYIKPMALDWTNVTFPQPFRWASEDIGAHDGARVIGTIEGINRLKDGTIWGYGTFDMDSELGKDAQRHVEKHLSNGVSLDLDRISAEVSDAGSLSSEIANLADAVQDMNITTIRSARTRSATLVALPAFEGARIEAVSSWSHGKDDNDEMAETPIPRSNKKFSKFAMQLRRNRNTRRRLAKTQLALQNLKAAPSKTTLATKQWRPKMSQPVSAAVGTFIGIDAGGNWHATIPTKGNRWIDMPGGALKKLQDMVKKQYTDNPTVDSDQATLDQAVGELPAITDSVFKKLEADDVEGAQADVQGVLDGFPFEDYTGNGDTGFDDEENEAPESSTAETAEQVQQALQAFVDIHPDEFREMANNGGIKEGEAPEDGQADDAAASDDAAAAEGDPAADPADPADSAAEGDPAAAGDSAGGEDWFVSDDYVDGWDDEEKAAFKAKLDEVKADAPEGWTFSGPSEDAPFGQFTNDESGDTVTPAPQTSEHVEPDPSGMEFWVFSGEAFETQTAPNWDEAIQTMDEGYGDIEGEDRGSVPGDAPEGGAGAGDSTASKQTPEERAKALEEAGLTEEDLSDPIPQDVIDTLPEGSVVVQPGEVSDLLGFAIDMPYVELPEEWFQKQIGMSDEEIKQANEDNADGMGWSGYNPELTGVVYSDGKWYPSGGGQGFMEGEGWDSVEEYAKGIEGEEDMHDSIVGHNSQDIMEGKSGQPNPDTTASGDSSDPRGEAGGGGKEQLGEALGALQELSQEIDAAETEVKYAQGRSDKAREDKAKQALEQLKADLDMHLEGIRDELGAWGADEKTVAGFEPETFLKPIAAAREKKINQVMEAQGLDPWVNKEKEAHLEKSRNAEAADAEKPKLEARRDVALKKAGYNPATATSTGAQWVYDKGTGDWRLQGSEGNMLTVTKDGKVIDEGTVNGPRKGGPQEVIGSAADGDGDGKTGIMEEGVSASEAGSKGGKTTSPWKTFEQPETMKNPATSEWAPALVVKEPSTLEGPGYKMEVGAYTKDTFDGNPNFGGALDALESRGATGWTGSVGYHKGQFEVSKPGVGAITAGSRGDVSAYVAENPRARSAGSMKRLGDFKTAEEAVAAIEAAKLDTKKMGLNRGVNLASEDRETMASLVASGAKLAAPIKPPAEWFTNPNFRMGTPLTVTKEGRVFGHLALWGTCHAAFGGAAGNCVSVPTSETEYSMFHLGVVETAEGTEVPVGRLAMSTGHADDQFGSRKAIAHYENTGFAVADIHAGEDQFGIWISGALRPDATPTQIRALKASPLSGDWRHHPQTNNLELVMALAVNMPGFAVPRPKFMVASGAVRSLTAAGMVPPKTVPRAKVEAALAGDQLAIDDIKFLQKLAARERANEAKALKQRALVASGAPNKIHALAEMLKGTKPVEGKK